MASSEKIIVAVIVILSLLMFGIMPLANAEKYYLLNEWDIKVRPNTNTFAEDIAVDGAGNVFIALAGENSVQKYSGNGTLLTSWDITFSDNDALLTEWQIGSIDSVQIDSNVHGVAVDNNGNVYVVDSGFAPGHSGYWNRIQKFDNQGSFITEWGSFESGEGPFDTWSGFTTDSARNVYVSSNDIKKFDGNGVLMPWSASSEILQSEGGSVAVDTAGNIYVTSNNSVKKFNNKGNYLTQWEFYGSDIAIDAEGNIYVVNDDRVQKFSSVGTLVAEWGDQGSKYGQFEFPESVAVDSLGNVYVSVGTSGDGFRLQKFWITPPKAVATVTTLIPKLIPIVAITLVIVSIVAGLVISGRLLYSNSRKAKPHAKGR